MRADIRATVAWGLVTYKKSRIGHFARAPVLGSENHWCLATFWGQMVVLSWWSGARIGWQMFCICYNRLFTASQAPCGVRGSDYHFVQCYSSAAEYIFPYIQHRDSFKDTSDISKSASDTDVCMYVQAIWHLKSHLDVYSLDNTGDDVEHLHFSVTLCHLLQQLKEQPKDRLEILYRV